MVLRASWTVRAAIKYQLSLDRSQLGGVTLQLDKVLDSPQRGSDNWCQAWDKSQLSGLK